MHRGHCPLCLCSQRYWTQAKAAPVGPFLCPSPSCLLPCLGWCPRSLPRAAASSGLWGMSAPQAGCAPPPSPAPEGMVLGCCACPPWLLTTYRRLPLLLFPSWASGQSWCLCQARGKSHTLCGGGLSPQGPFVQKREPKWKPRAKIQIPVVPRSWL